jgi:hypothetical protein
VETQWLGPVGALEERGLAVSISLLSTLNAVFPTPSSRLASKRAELENSALGATQTHPISRVWVGSTARSTVMLVVVNRPGRGRPFPLMGYSLGHS